MTKFTEHDSYSIDEHGHVTHFSSSLPSAVMLPAVKVSLAPETHPLVAAKLLRRLADELEVRR